MCGICGIVRPEASSASDRELVRRMMDLLAHRGPDGAGLWESSPAVLGHRRLAVIDIEGGHQPLVDSSGDIGVVFNGEIYNYRELRKELSAAGHRFATAGDTEVLVHGYRYWGDDLVTRLRGMFAFAIWDAPRQRLLLARDRLGIKPLYLFEEGGRRFLFASEIKALFADPDVPRAINEKKLAEFMAFRSIAGEETLFRGIRELSPGSILIYENGRARERRYWAPEVPEKFDPDPVRRGSDLLRSAVESQLVSDVKLGSITSGGLDSSLVSAIAAGATQSGAIDTFCAGFSDPTYDERPFARAVADRIGSIHHEIVVEPEEIESELDRLTWAHDEPLTHPNSIPMHLLFRDARERAGVTVLLSGEGADEVFGGYDWYRVAMQRERLARIPGIGLLGRLAPFGRLATLKRVLHPDYLLGANATVAPPRLDPLLGMTGDPLTSRRQLWSERRRASDALFLYDQQTYLLPLLQRQDRMSMAAGLEARVPFLDHHLVEWANGLTAEVKLANGVRKALLKRVAREWLDPSIIDRKKVGFAMPIGQWLRRGGALHSRVRRLTREDSPLRDFVATTAIRRITQEHESGADHTDILWSLVALDAWFGTFLTEGLTEHALPGSKQVQTIFSSQAAFRPLPAASQPP